MKVFSIELYDSDGVYKVIYVAANDRNEAVDVMKASYNETRYDVMCLEGAIFRTDKPCEIKTRFCIEDDKVVLSEDERIRGAIIDHLKDNDLIEWAAWLENKTTWSREDEVQLTNIIIMLKEGASHHFVKRDITNSVDWLKSLKERYS